MQVRALVPLHTAHGVVRRGETFSIEPHYLDELNKSIKQVERLDGPLEPTHTQAFASAPVTQGKAAPSAAPPRVTSVQAPVESLAAGPGKPLSVSPRAPASRKPT